MTGNSRRTRTCASCGRRIDQEVLICPYCGDDRELKLQLARTRDIEEPMKRDYSLPIALSAVAVVAIIVVAGVFIVLDNAHKTNLRLELDFLAFPLLTEVGSGAVTIGGLVYNDGNVAERGIVHIRVFDGYSWHSYIAGTGEVPPGGSVPFTWARSYDQFAVNNVQVEWSVHG